MFGFSFIQLYFIINMLYTIIMFFFLHNIVSEKMYKNHHKITDKYMTNKEIKIAMNLFYIIGAFLGSLRLFKDILNLILDHRTCIWLHRIYEKKSASDIERLKKHIDDALNEMKEKENKKK